MSTKDLKAKMSNFDFNAILRGAQLTLVGAHRALQNPSLFTSDHYRQVAIAVVAGIAIRIIIAIPILSVQALIWFLGLFMDLEHATWDNDLIQGLHFLENSVLQVPFFLMSLLRSLSPTLDNLFIESLAWVDRTYYQKHQSEDPQNLRASYHQNLKMYPRNRHDGPKKSNKEKAFTFALRYSRKAGISLAIYLLSYLPIVGRFVLPAASFYTFNKAVGTPPAVLIFASGLVVPKHYLVRFLQTYFSSRSLMRELLDPYFSRVHFTKEQKKAWFRDREGVLFGFGVGFFVFLKIPLLGVLIYGVAEASTAYLITKITDPPPPPVDEAKYAESQVSWKNKHDFMTLSLGNIDALNVETSAKKEDPLDSGMPGKTFS
ncbi:hypothetical protein EJ05DRAFT_504856 [Pseudovirgaria hyperparasitica]|uniref:Transmembrane protein UsgS n=1 Tax=Pseudovirgaria hyperparasitica TaxID=470096 RepID=A0A6A6VVV7_9PEZI|nr:uncharacterized protein EJ05DRAFT_504856 [Pseudovirgaria hyperparasitica]KAF2753770.1 hypothetical protein EJ05DRAFT_504856 [Pseudovirgaria hyperparasitica]